MRLGLLLLVLTVHATVGAAQEPLSGAIYVDPDLVVNEGETLVLGPGAVLTGPGRVIVRGTLDARGEEGAPVEWAVPLDLVGGTATLRHVRVWGMDGDALTVKSGRLTLEEAMVEGNGVGLLVDAAAPATVVVRNATLRDHAQAAAILAGPLDATLSNVTFRANARNVAYLPAGGAALALEDARLEASVTRAPSLHAYAAEGVAATLQTRRSAFDGGDVAVRAQGAGLQYVSEDDVFTGPRVGLVLEGAEATLTRAQFSTLERDVDASPTARVSLADVRLTPAAATTPAPAPAGGASAWLVLGALAVAGGGAIAWARLRPQRPAPPPLPPAEDAAPPAPMPEPDLASPVSELERRILADIARHPGTPQAAVAARLGMTRQALHYHVKKLEARRLLRKVQHGRETRCTVAPGVEALLP